MKHFSSIYVVILKDICLWVSLRGSRPALLMWGCLVALLPHGLRLCACILCCFASSGFNLSSHIFFASLPRTSLFLPSKFELDRWCTNNGDLLWYRQNNNKTHKHTFKGKYQVMILFSNILVLGLSPVKKLLFPFYLDTKLEKYSLNRLTIARKF